MRLSILIPVYNEAHSIGAVLKQVITAPAAYFQSTGIAVELIVVDDGSRDGSYEAVQAFSDAHPTVALLSLRHERNSGKGAAIRTAIKYAKGDFCIIQDADFEYDPADYPRLLTPLFNGEADVVLGSRFMNASRRQPFRFWQALANKVITIFAGMAAGLFLSDAETGYKAFRTSLAQTIPLFSTRFGLDPELIVQFAKRHARFLEVPIAYRGRTKEQGKKIGALDALFALATILRARLWSAAHTDPATDMLVAMSHARRFNAWMAEQIQPWIRGDVLEIGAGIGNMTVLLATPKNRYTATENDSESLAELRSRTAYGNHVKAALFDFADSDEVARFHKSADTVVCLNVLEHVDDDRAGLRNIRACLRDDGIAIILVPQGPQAFGRMDQVLDHKRRYTQDELRSAMTQAGFEVIELIEFNRATWPGWYLNSKLLRRRTLSHVQLRAFDLLVPLWRRIDGNLPWPPTSLIAIGITAPK